MKQIFFILSVLVFIISCKNEPTAKNTSLDFIRTYTGKIDNKYPLHIKLTATNGKVSGRYFYDKVGTDIEIIGTIAGDSTIHLTEFDENAYHTGLWTGKLSSDHIISGTWSKPNGKSTKDFILMPTTVTYESAREALFDTKFSKYSGTYNSPFNDEGISFGQLIINYNHVNELAFEIHTAHESGCTGNLKGIAKISTTGVAKYSSETCDDLTFKFENDEVLVSENNCGHHGMRCYFTGKYKK